MWCFFGQFVVNCVVNVDSGWSLFGGLKFGDFLKFIFACPWTSYCARGPWIWSCPSCRSGWGWFFETAGVRGWSEPTSQRRDVGHPVFRGGGGRTCGGAAVGCCLRRGGGAPLPFQNDGPVAVRPSA